MKDVYTAELEPIVLPASALVASYLIKSRATAVSANDISQDIQLARLLVYAQGSDRCLVEYIQKAPNFANCLDYMTYVRMCIDMDERSNPMDFNFPSAIHHWLSNMVHAIHDVKNRAVSV